MGYAGFAALGASELGASEGRGPAWLAVVLGPLVVVLVFRHLEARDVDDDRVPEGARSAARAITAGVVVAGVACTSASDALREIGLAAGAALASVGALIAAQRFPSEGGLLAPPRDAAPRAELGAAIALGAAHVAALLLLVTPAHATRGVPPLAREAAVPAAALFGAALVLAACGRALVARRLELGVADRAGASLQVAAIAILAAVGASAAGIVRPQVSLPLAAAIASMVTAAAAVTRDATAVRSAGRVVAAVLLSALPPSLLAAWLARVEPRAAGVAALVAALAAAAGGLAAPALGRLLGPERTRRERAIALASDAALHPEPHVAIERALLALRDHGGPRLAEAALYRLAPAEVLRVDRGGYVVTEAAEVPPTLLALAEAEPLGIVRAEALRAAEVRRADVRPLAAWLTDRRIGAGVVIHDESGAAALLAVPRGPRDSVLELDEARALRRLADRIGAAAAAGAALARSLEREADARRLSLARDSEAGALRVALERGARHLEATTGVLARPARVAAYGPASRGALERVERLAETSRVLTLLAPPGIDATAWAAVWHLASPRRAATFLVVDGVSAAREPLSFWREPTTSPLEGVADGTLLLLDPQALPMDVQSYLGASAERIALAVAVPRTASALVGEGRLHERLADPLGDRAVAIPPLAARAEDLRGLVQEHLARAGVRLRGTPLAVDGPALAELLEHTWPGNDVELAAVLTRAAVVASGSTITRADLAAIGFHAEASPREGASARKAGARRR